MTPDRPVAPDLRPATARDADAIADVYLRSRKELVACAPLAHPDDTVRRWVRERLVPAGRTTVAVTDGRVIGFLTVSTDAEASWIEHLYLLPAWVGRGVGTRLLDLARRRLAPPVRLHTFQGNERARRFYESREFTAIAFGDGSLNEEKRPDILYEWRPAPPA
jgi:ribosomal protein S18 acetylase RimI-like enzyme